MLNKRWVTLDIVKSLTVIAMIFVHNAIWWLSYHPAFIQGAQDSWFIVAGALSFFVMLIPVTAGAALYFYFGQHRQKALPPFTEILKRAVLLILVGYIMNYFAFGYDSTFQWNVLQFFSVGMIVVFLVLRFLNLFWLIFFGILAVLSAPFLREIFSEHDNYIVSILVGDPYGAHIWPLFPWFSLLTVGFTVAYFCVSNLPPFKKRFMLMCSGTALVATTSISGPLLLNFDFKNLWGETIFQPPTMQVFGIIGVALIVFGLVELLTRNRFLVTTMYAQVLGVGLFYIYVAHMVIGHQLQLRVLKNNDDINVLWLAIIFQIIIAYFIGKFVCSKKRASG